jgi:hypothetical protein
LIGRFAYAIPALMLGCSNAKGILCGDVVMPNAMYALPLSMHGLRVVWFRPMDN